MNLLKSVRKRSFLSEAAYIVLNVALAAALLGLALTINTPWVALGLILLSKWRVFAVRSRYWSANIRANLIDTIVGLSVVVFLYATSGETFIQVGLTIAYALWLLVVKPRSKRNAIAAQAAVGLLLGISAIVQVSPELPASVVVLLGWIVGYASARHILSAQHESHINFLSLLWGFVTAEVLWLTYHWTIGYQISGSLQFAQVTLIIALLSFVAERLYASYHKNGRVQSGDVLLPALLSLSVIIVLLFVFGSTATI